MVCSGLTVFVPTQGTGPVLGDKTQSVTSVKDQDRVAVSPANICVGVTSKDTSGKVINTATVVEALTSPTLFVAVMIYSFVVSGAISIEPIFMTVPIFGSIETVSASVDVQLRITFSPQLISEALAVKVTSGSGFGSVTSTVISRDAAPPGPVAVMVYVVVCAGEIWTSPAASTFPGSGVIVQDVV